MLAGSQFRLRQGFRPRRKHLYGAPAPPRLAGPHGDVPVRVCLHFSCLGELALFHRLPCVKGAVSRKADWDCSSKQHSSGFPARWGRYPLGVSFERAKETKTRLGRSPLSTPLRYQAVNASRLGSARHSYCGSCFCRHTRSPWEAGPTARWFSQPGLPWRSGVPAAGNQAAERWKQQLTRVRPW